VHACALENNISRAPQVHWIRVLEMQESKGIDLPESSAYYCAPLRAKDTGADRKTRVAVDIEESRDSKVRSPNLEAYSLSDEEREILRTPGQQSGTASVPFLHARRLPAMSQSPVRQGLPRGSTEIRQPERSGQ
jgi:hypothetical protein